MGRGRQALGGEGPGRQGRIQGVHKRTRLQGGGRRRQGEAPAGRRLRGGILLKGLRKRGCHRHQHRPQRGDDRCRRRRGVEEPFWHQLPRCGRRRPENDRVVGLRCRLQLRGAHGHTRLQVRSQRGGEGSQQGGRFVSIHPCFSWGWEEDDEVLCDWEERILKDGSRDHLY